jgi:hypothetical protein
MMGCETVLVGMAGAGGAAGAAGGAAAMGVAVPMAPAATSSSSTSQLQYDGTVNTSTTADRLPPITLTQKGWPELPGWAAECFQSASPVELPENTPLYRMIDDTSNPSGPWWTVEVPADKDSWRSGWAVLSSWNDNGKMAVGKAPKGGLKVWVGRAASQQEPGPGGQIYPGGKAQIYMPAGTLTPEATYSSS